MACSVLMLTWGLADEVPLDAMPRTTTCDVAAYFGPASTA